MPASIISNMSYSGAPRSQLAATIAKDIAHREVALRIKSGILNQNDSASIDREYRAIYTQEYYKNYAHFLQQEQQPRITYVVKDNLESKRYFAKHSVVNFSKLNCLIHVHKECITVARIKYPIDDNSSLDTKEAFLTDWPGPLDQSGEQVKRCVTGYLDTLWQHDSQRSIRYVNHDDHRKTILKLLIELLHRNGTIDAPGITRLLLKAEQTEIRKEDGSNQPLETLKKYLLLGKRGEAIKFAKTRKIWDHAQCLAFLDKYQPPNSGSLIDINDGSRLKDHPIVQLNDEYLSCMEPGILHTVYRSLLNRILQSDPESVNITQYPNVENDPYKFALLSANDCEMEFDQTNQIFKLIVAIKQAMVDPMRANSHLISLGLISIDGNDTNDDLSYQSNLSIKPGDTCALRTLTISNIDMLILNEIWEYCLNLAGRTCDPNNYRYMINLVPYKLVFAARLFDFGLYDMFYNYLCSIKNALAKSRIQAYEGCDPFYDWITIGRCVDHLDQIFELLRMNPETLPQPLPSKRLLAEEVTEFSPRMMSPQLVDKNLPDPQPAYNQFNGPNERAFQFSQIPVSYPRNTFMPMYNHQSIPEEVTESTFNPEPMPLEVENQNVYDSQPSHNEYPNESFRRTSQQSETIAPVFSPPTFGPGGVTSVPDQTKTTMKSSSPNRESQQPNPSMGESFPSPFSPINEYDDLPRRNSDFDRRGSNVSNNLTTNDRTTAGNSIGNQLGSSNNVNNGSTSRDNNDQQPSFLTKLWSKASLLPKNQAHLPDDANNPIVFDEQGRYVNPDGVDSGVTDDAPPLMDTSLIPPKYSMSKDKRYPKTTSSQSSRAVSSARFN